MDKKKLDQLICEYNTLEHRSKDPVKFLYRYKKELDKEIVAFISSSFAYGRVEQILLTIEKILKPMGEFPSKFLLNEKNFMKYYGGFKHRFNTSNDLLLFLGMLKNILKKYDSLKNLFSICYNNKQKNYFNALNEFIFILRNEINEVSVKTKISMDKVFYLLPLPERGSACKRLNLFFKWMFRKDNIDPGLWKNSFPEITSQLIIPLDTHILKCALNSGMTNRKTNTLKTALDITNYLKKFEPYDPLKYDFAICHNGMINFRNIKSK